MSEAARFVWEHFCWGLTHYRENTKDRGGTFICIWCLYVGMTDFVTALLSYCTCSEKDWRSRCFSHNKSRHDGQLSISKSNALWWSEGKGRKYAIMSKRLAQYWLNMFLHREKAGSLTSCKATICSFVHLSFQFLYTLNKKDIKKKSNHWVLY